MKLFSDLRYALRLLLKKPGFSALTIVIMATGLCLSVYMFSFLHTALFKPLPFPRGGDIVRITGTLNGAKDIMGYPIDLHDTEQIREGTPALETVSVYRSANVTITGRDGARRYRGIFTEPAFFAVTATQPILGRLFTAAESAAGSEPVVLIGHDVWQNQFAGDRSVIDRKVKVDGVSHRIIGVMPQGYYFPSTAAIWLPMGEQAAQSVRGTTEKYFGAALLRRGASLQEANRQISLVMQRLEDRYPKTNTAFSANIDTFPMQAAADGLVVVRAMQVAALLIIVLAALNVGNMLLSRAVERGKETAVRMAIGAPKGRLITQMLWESVIICAVAALVSLGVLAWALPATNGVIASFFPDKPLFWWSFGVDGYTLRLFAVFVVITLLLTGVLPAWRNASADVNALLRDGTRGALGKRAGRVNHVLVISEVFGALAVLIAAVTIVVGTYRNTHADYGADPQRIVSSRVQLPSTDSRYQSDEGRIEFIKRLRARLEATSGVERVMIASVLPGENTARPAFAIDGVEYVGDGEGSYPRANYISTVPGTLASLGVELREGRYFATTDDGQARRTVIVSESFVDKHLGGVSPLGKRIRMASTEGDEQAWLTVVGVVEHTVQGQPHGESGRFPSVYRPAYQAAPSEMTVAIRSEFALDSATRVLRDALRAVDPDVPAYRVERYEESIDRNTKSLAFMSSIFLMFGIAAAIVTASGVYGVMSNTLSQRTQEIGVRMALGAHDGRIVRDFLGKEAKRLLWGGVPGAVIGTLMGVAMSRIFATSLSSVLIVAVAMVVLISAVTVLATYLPLRRTLVAGASQALRFG